MGGNTDLISTHRIHDGEIFLHVYRIGGKPISILKKDG